MNNTRYYYFYWYSAATCSLIYRVFLQQNIFFLIQRTIQNCFHCIFTGSQVPTQVLAGTENTIKRETIKKICDKYLICCAEGGAGSVHVCVYRR